MSKFLHPNFSKEEFELIKAALAFLSTHIEEAEDELDIDICPKKLADLHDTCLDS